ncbi:predicted protein [Sclerotinia sclerotiorum 1980 UF-70]|uniref:Uncharacterized protein n=2 Tax=Sclerotinia sclerotiorum (strain ATCC 18683 / 1980 / Ss-1) TaxID=665079 RepID=A7EKP1_SCLS1|nr:predicted protein [Sclerotinia sclerotiorum 1980 UF-70]APA09876.1 hypothetical protein sscle_05g046460 [Sclerotinia sclerotiorum 1980 UF-70]EDO03407.1 predicted protein [Sclerotinia sclerotiorum 1980 UF-70]
MPLQAGKQKDLPGEQKGKNQLPNVNRISLQSGRFTASVSQLEENPHAPIGPEKMT